MALCSHGVACYVFARRMKFILVSRDTVALSAPPGLFFGASALHQRRALWAQRKVFHGRWFFPNRSPSNNALTLAVLPEALCEGVIFLLCCWPCERRAIVVEW